MFFKIERSLVFKSPLNFVLEVKILLLLGLLSLDVFFELLNLVFLALSEVLQVLQLLSEFLVALCVLMLQGFKFLMFFLLLLSNFSELFVLSSHGLLKLTELLLQNLLVLDLGIELLPELLVVFLALSQLLLYCVLLHVHEIDLHFESLDHLGLLRVSLGGQTLVYLDQLLDLLLLLTHLRSKVVEFLVESVGLLELLIL